MTVAGGRRRVNNNVISVTALDTWSQILADKHPSLKTVPDEDGYVGLESLNRKLRLVQCDITDLQVDAVVCAVQTDLHLPPVGMCEEFWMKGGHALKQACLEVDVCDAGQAFLTNGYNLLSKYVIHTAGPSPTCLMDYTDRVACLKQSYLSCLNCVTQNEDIHSVAFPCLGSGGARLQLSDAIAVGVETIRSWLEQGTNANMVDHIVLCMYSEDMRSLYVDHLTHVFPSGKDLADLDLELLTPVDTEVLTLPQQLPHGNITPVLCFKYEPGVGRTIQHHFHQLVNACMQQLTDRRIPTARRIRAELETRYRDCAVVKLKSHCYKLVVYHSPPSCTIELQLVNFSESGVGIDKAVCRAVRDVIRKYLSTNLENLLVPDVVYVRCGDSPWGSQYGLWAVHTLQKPSVTELLCTHMDSLATTHTVTPRALLKYWHTHSSVTERGSRRSSRSAVSSTSSSSESDHPPPHTPLSHSDSSEFDYLPRLTPVYRSVDENSDEETFRYTPGCVLPSEKAASSRLSSSTFTKFTSSAASTQCIGDNSSEAVRQQPHRDRVHRYSSTKVTQTKEQMYSDMPTLTYDVASFEETCPGNVPVTSIPTGWCANINAQGREPTEQSDHFQTVDNVSLLESNIRVVRDDPVPLMKQQVRSNQETNVKTMSASGVNKPKRPSDRRAPKSQRQPSDKTSERSPILAGRSGLSESHRTVQSNFPRVAEQLTISEPVMSDDNPVSQPNMATYGHGSYSDNSLGPSCSATDISNRNRVKLPTTAISTMSSFMLHNRPNIQPTVRSLVLTDEVLSQVVSKVGSQHYMLGLRLGIDSKTIDVIQHNHQNDAMRQCFHILKTWRCKTGATATIDKLLDEMKDLGMETEDLRAKYMCR